MQGDSSYISKKVLAQYQCLKTTTCNSQITRLNQTPAYWYHSKDSDFFLLIPPSGLTTIIILIILFLCMYLCFNITGLFEEKKKRRKKSNNKVTPWQWIWTTVVSIQEKTSSITCFSIKWTPPTSGSTSNFMTFQRESCSMFDKGKTPSFPRSPQHDMLEAQLCIAKI